MTQSKLSTLALALVLGVGCGPAPTEATVRVSDLPLAERVSPDGLFAIRVGSLRFYGDTLRLEAPTRADVNVPLDIHVSTYGGGCVGSDTTVTTVAGLRTTIVPYQRELTNPKLVCTKELVVDRRRVRVTFGTPGTATLRVVGREAPSGRLFAVERRIVVR